MKMKIFYQFVLTCFILVHWIHAEEDRFENLQNDIAGYFETKLEPEGFVKQGEGQEYSFVNDDKKSSVKVVESGSAFNIYLQNEYETQEMTLENIDFKDQQAMIEEEYINHFLNHVKEIKGNQEDIFAALSAGFENLSYKGSLGESSLVNVALVTSRLRERILAANKNKKPKNSAKKEKKPAKKKKKESSGSGGSSDSLVFQMDFTNESLNETGGKDVIYGEISKEEEGWVIRILTKFFEKVFDLKITTDNFLTGEAKNFGVEILRHLDSMYYLNEYQPQERPESLTVEDYNSHLQELIESSIVGGKMEQIRSHDDGEDEEDDGTDDEETADAAEEDEDDFSFDDIEEESTYIISKISIGEKEVAEVKVKIDGKRADILVVRIKLETENQIRDAISLPVKSIYMLEGILDAFVLNRLKRMERVVTKLPEELVVKVFKE